MNDAETKAENIIHPFAQRGQGRACLGIPVAVMRKGRAVAVSAEEALRIVREERASYTVKQR